MSVLYRSYKDVHGDLRRWSSHMPTISAISGVPRSGILCATMLAEELHVPYIPIEALISTDRLVYRPPISRHLHRNPGPILILDDTSWTGKTLLRVKESVTEKNVIYGAVYGSDNSIGQGIISIRGYKLKDIWHSFAWNLLRDYLGKHSLTDMDGVLCEDWGKPDTGSWLQPYLDFLGSAKPLHKTNRPVYGVVTARLNKYRRLTEAWLRKHHYQYRNLIMSPHDSPEERHRKNGFGAWKAEIYLAHKDHAKMFVESCPKQSQEIAKKTGLPVLSFEEQRLYNGTEPEPAW